MLPAADVTGSGASSARKAPGLVVRLQRKIQQPKDHSIGSVKSLAACESCSLPPQDKFTTATTPPVMLPPTGRPQICAAHSPNQEAPLHQESRHRDGSGSPVSCYEPCKAAEQAKVSEIKWRLANTVTTLDRYERNLAIVPAVAVPDPKATVPNPEGGNEAPLDTEGGEVVIGEQPDGRSSLGHGIYKADTFDRSDMNTNRSAENDARRLQAKSSEAQPMMSILPILSDQSCRTGYDLSPARMGQTENLPLPVIPSKDSWPTRPSKELLVAKGKSKSNVRCKTLEAGKDNEVPARRKSSKKGKLAKLRQLVSVSANLGMATTVTRPIKNSVKLVTVAKVTSSTSTTGKALAAAGSLSQDDGMVVKTVKSSLHAAIESKASGSAQSEADFSAMAAAPLDRVAQQQSASSVSSQGGVKHRLLPTMLNADCQATLRTVEGQGLDQEGKTLIQAETQQKAFASIPEDASTSIKPIIDLQKQPDQTGPPFPTSKLGTASRELKLASFLARVKSQRRGITQGSKPKDPKNVAASHHHGAPVFFELTPRLSGLENAAAALLPGTVQKIPEASKEGEPQTLQPQAKRIPTLAPQPNDQHARMSGIGGAAGVKSKRKAKFSLSRPSLPGAGIRASPLYHRRLLHKASRPFVSRLQASSGESLFKGHMQKRAEERNRQTTEEAQAEQIRTESEESQLNKRSKHPAGSLADRMGYVVLLISIPLPTLGPKGNIQDIWEKRDFRILQCSYISS